MKLSISQEKGLIGRKYEHWAHTHFYVSEIDSPMPAKIRFPEGMDSPCQSVLMDSKIISVKQNLHIVANNMRLC